MKAAAGLLTGTHDFKSFCGNKKMKKSTVRTIEKIEFEQSGSRLHIYLQEMDFTADGTYPYWHADRSGTGKMCTG